MKSESKTTVLNVNDQLIARYTTHRTLAHYGFTVIDAVSGSEALALAQSERPDVIVLDVLLPDIDGLEVCRQLKRAPETAPMKILMTSATLVSSSRRVLGLDAGADAYLVLPAEAEELVAIVRALSRLAEAERAERIRADLLLEADRRKDEFLAMLGHELRNPLAAIRSALMLLNGLPARTPVETRAREVLGRQSHNISRLVDDLLEVARVTQGRISLREDRVDLGALVSRVAQGIKEAQPSDSSVVLTLEVGDSPIWVRGDAVRLEQIVSNLIDNAFKYSTGKGSIEVSLRKLPSDGLPASVEFSVRDQGIGIAPEEQEQLFTTFYQARPGFARTRGGLGLGLALVKRLAELHSGKVEVRSAGIGKGSEFLVRLPRYEATQTREEDREQAAR